MRRILTIIGIIVAINALLSVVGLILRRRIPSRGGEESDEIALAAVARGIDLSSRATAFRGGSARAIMGGLRLDLRQAMLAPGGATLDLTAIMGGVQLLIPSAWRVTASESTAVLGGVDAPEDTPSDIDSRPLLTIRCLSVLGGIQVTARPEDILLSSEPADRAEFSANPST